MQHDRPMLVTSVNSRKPPVLIIDKKGTIGAELGRRLLNQFLVLLVSGTGFEVERNIIHIPYRRKIPLIPDNSYSHMFLIYNGEDEILDMLPTFIKKAQETHARIFFITTLAHSSYRLFHRLSNQLYNNMPILVCGEIFDNNLTEQNELNFFINQIRLYGKVDIPNTGLGMLYPILLEDVMQAIIAIGFALERRSRIQFIFPKSGITEISTGRILQKISPSIRLDFKKQRMNNPDYYFPKDANTFYPDYDLEQRLRTIDFSKRPLPAVHKPKKTITLPQTQRRTNIIFILAVLLFCFILLPAFASLTFALIGAATLSTSVKEAEHAKFSSAKTYATIANISFNSADTALSSFFLLDVIAKDKKQKALDNVMVGEELTRTELDIIDACMQLEKVSAGKSLDPKNDFLRSLATLKNAFIVLQRMKAENQLPKEVQTKLNDMNDILSILENTSDSFPALFGFQGKRTYLVLFQNNMELRPGGGFIGSYGLLTIENGKIGEFKVNDVYDADGKLATHVEPPYGLRRYLGVAHWYLRDSNFDVDFTKDAEQAAKFLAMEVGTHVDGVIGVDTDFMRDIIRAFGSVTIPDYKETVTPDNFYLLTQTYVEKDFFPGSTQKKDFLRSLTNAMVIQLSEQHNLPYRRFLETIGESIRSKHLLFAFPDSATQTLFTVNDLSSSLWDGRTQDADTLLDFFGVIDANVGANKANYYISRSIQHTVKLENNGNLQEKVSVNYINSSKKDSPFGGDYKNYVRFVLPDGAALQTIAVNGQEIQGTPAITDPAIFTQPGFLPPSELEVERTQEEGKTIYGFFVNIPIGSTTKVSLTYKIPQAINTDNPSFTYNLRLFKQPGTRDDPYSLSFGYPTNYKLIDTSQRLNDLGGKQTYETNLAADTDVRMEYSQK